MEPAKKRELRDVNLRVWAGAKDIFPVRSSQDSSLKKNTAFIKRLRTAISGPNVHTFTQEVGSLSLHKYLSELISACYEGLSKLKTPADVAAGVEVVSALHQRFGPAEFTGYLGWLIGRGLSTPDKAQLKALAADVREREEKDRLARHRVLLRVATELWLAGVLRSLEDVARPDSESKGKDGGKSSESTAKTKSGVNAAKPQAGEQDPFPLEVLKDLLGHDREHTNLPLVVLFVKTFSWEVLGIKARATTGRKTGQEVEADSGAKTEEASQSDDGPPDSEPPIVTEELSHRFKNILIRYFEDVKTHILRDQKTILAQGRRNAEAYVRSGEVFEDRQANFEKQNKAQEKLMANAQVLADVLGEDMPDLQDKEETQTSGDGTIGLVKVGDYLKGQGDAGIWEDEDERRFYENLMDVKDRVPGILLEEGKKKKADGDDQVGKKSDAKPNADDTTETKPTDTVDQTTAIANKSVGAQVDGLLARLPDLHSKDGIDQFAIDFCFVNSKASRNRLIKALLDVPKGRTDLLPLYSRIVATLSKYMPDITTAMITHLDDEFRSLQRRKSKEFLGSVRLQNIRYFAELTKFGIVPEHVIFHCFKVCLDELNRTNVEILGSLMENCGRYLLRNPDTSPRMSSFLETLQRKRGAQHLDQRERLILENAIYHVNPPERPAIEQKERSPLELFIQKIVYDDMTKRNVEKVTKQIRKLHWEEPEVVNILEKVFTKPWKVKYNNVHLLAVILGSIHRYHPQFSITCVDELLEQITHGLEFNDVKYNQRRIAQVKYLGELYVYRMVDSAVIFDTMYKILTFGHEGGTPRPDVENLWDMPNDWFRIRLVCILLETCGGFFDKGLAKTKLDFFISFFQYYFNTKDKLSPDIEFAIQDAFAVISPSLRMIGNLEEAAKQFAEAVKENYQKDQNEKISNEVEEIEEDSMSEDGDDDEDAVVEEDEKSSADEDAVDAAEDSDEVQSSDEEDEQIVVTRQEEERDPALDADFDRELAKLMAESMDARKLERKTFFDVPLPLRRKEREATADDHGENAVIPEPTLVKFSLLSKRGNKQQTRDIDLPADSTFAVAMRNQQQAEKLEQKRIKDIVLGLDLRDEIDGPDGEDPISFLQPNENLRKSLQPRSRGSDASRRAPSLDSSDPPGANNHVIPSSAANLLGFLRPSASKSVQLFSQATRRSASSLQRSSSPVQRSSSLVSNLARQPQTLVADKNLNTHTSLQKGTLEKNPPNPYLQPRLDKAGKGRANQRGRQLQVSDLDWT